VIQKWIGLATGRYLGYSHRMAENLIVRRIKASPIGPLIERLPSPGVGISKGIHWTTRRIFKGMGFEFETRRIGELKLGIWKKTLNPDSPRVKRLVMVPGFGDTPLAWTLIFGPLLGRLKKEYSEFSILDFPGYNGILSEDPAFSSFELKSRAVFDYLDSIRPDTVVGHSLGGWLAGAYATQWGRGERPKHAAIQYEGPRLLVLISPSGVIHRASEGEEFQRKFNQGMEEGFDSFRPYLFYKESPFFKIFAKAFSNFFLKKEIRDFITSIDKDHFLNHKLEAIKGDVCLIWGDHDQLTQSSWIYDWLAELKKRKKGQVVGVYLPKAGHMVHLEKTWAMIGLFSKILRGRMRELSTRDRFWKVLGDPSPTGNR